MFEIKEPKEASMAFGAMGPDLKELIPDRADLPEEFQRNWTHNEWCEVASHIFYKGGSELEFYPKEEVDPSKAFKHIMAVLKSWEPQHEHKIGAVGFLFSEWFDDVVKDGKSMITGKEVKVEDKGSEGSSEGSSGDAGDAHQA
jgi:hypothetical protein